MRANLSLQEQSFAVNSIFQHLIFQLSLTFSPQSKFAASQVGISISKGVESFVLSPFQLVLKEARQEGKQKESFQHVYSVMKLQIHSSPGQITITQVSTHSLKERENTKLLVCFAGAGEFFQSCSAAPVGATQPLSVSPTKPSTISKVQMRLSLGPLM